MRPAKHVTHSKPPAQEVFDISIARRFSKTGFTPLVTTSEKGSITLFAWDDFHSTWQNLELAHAPVEVVRGVPSISNTWNWSRRVGLTSLAEFIYVVYKRAEAVAAGEDPKPAQLMLATFQMESSGSLSLVARFPVPMPTYRVVSRPPLDSFVESERPGFELWAGIDEKRRQLLIVTQTLGEDATSDGDHANLALMTGDLGRLDQTDGWQYKTLAAGGYGLDVRHPDDTLILAYRKTPAALTFPFPHVLDPFFSGPLQVEFNETNESDQFFLPLQLTFVSLSSTDTTTLDLPGGEHPRIQSIEPLMVTVDRPRLRVIFRVINNAEGNPEPRIVWQTLGVHKLALLFDNQEQLVARGVLMSFLQGDQPTFPRTSVPWVDAQDIYTGITPAGIGWASTWARFPLEPLQLASDAKGLFFDFLHKTPLFALQHSRARLATDSANGKLNVTDLVTEVYDINHEQIARPDSLRPDATGENTQFAPFTPLGQQSNNPIQAPTYFSDNTIGGSLVNDRDGQPFQFVSYTDLGDGGLRVIFDAKLGPPTAPTPPKKPKTLEPESVPGPGSGDEHWIELTATDWQDAKVPAITLLDVLSQPTLTSANHSRIESLLMGAFEFAGLGVGVENDWSETQVNSIQTGLNTFFISLGPIITPPDVRFSTDGTTPRAFISILPSTIVADAQTTWEAGIEGEAVAAVVWTFTSHLQGFPLAFSVAGNPVPVSLIVDGDWTVQADITRNDGSVRTFSTEVTAEESLFRKISSVHRKLSERGLDAPLDSIGNFRIGTATFKFLQYELRFPVEPDKFETHRVVIKTLDGTDAQWRFLPNGTKQGLIDYRLRIGFDTEDVRLKGLLGTLAKIERVQASFFYGRSFTPGILMNDTRSAKPLTGEEDSDDLLEHVPGEATRVASTITAKPHGNASITVNKVDVKVSMLPQAVTASVVTLLVGLGAAAAASILLFLLGMLTSALIAAAAPLAGLLAIAAVIAATVAVFIFVNFVVPTIVASAIADNIRNSLTNDDSVQALEDARFLQFAGEGIGESIAGQVIATLERPPLNASSIGEDRFRQNLFQMIHVSEGRCRVLIRT